MNNFCCIFFVAKRKVANGDMIYRWILGKLRRDAVGYDGAHFSPSSGGSLALFSRCFAEVTCSSNKTDNMGGPSQRLPY